MPLLREIEAIAKKQGKTRAWRRRYYVIIDLNLLYPEREGVESARNKAILLINKAIESVDSEVNGCFVDVEKSRFAFQHLFARLTGNQIKAVRAACGAPLTGPKARPMDAAWVRDLRDQCEEANVAFFFKQWGGTNKKKTGRRLDGRTHDAMPERTQPSAPLRAAAG